LSARPARWATLSQPEFQTTGRERMTAMTTLLDMTDEARDLAARLVTVEEARLEAETDEAKAALAEAEAALEELLAQVGDDITAKSDAYCDVIAEFTARADVMKAQEATYKQKRQVAENAARRLKDRLHYALEGLGLRKVEGERWTLAIQNSPPSATVTDEGLAVAAGFGEVVQTNKLDARGIVKAWKADPASVVAFADVRQGTHLRVR